MVRSKCLSTGLPKAFTETFRRKLTHLSLAHLSIACSQKSSTAVGEVIDNIVGLRQTLVTLVRTSVADADRRVTQRA